MSPNAVNLRLNRRCICGRFNGCNHRGIVLYGGGAVSDHIVILSNDVVKTRLDALKSGGEFV